MLSKLKHGLLKHKEGHGRKLLPWKFGTKKKDKAGVENRAEEKVSDGGSGEIYDVILYFGITDILQDYDISKKLEHAYKSLQVDPTSISAVDPKLYSKRFKDFIHRIHACK